MTQFEFCRDFRHQRTIIPAWAIARRCLRNPTFSRFSRTPTCFRQTDRHTTTARPNTRAIASVAREIIGHIRILIRLKTYIVANWATVCKTVPLCYQTVVCLSCLSVCDVCALWPNGWTDQDGTWHADRFRPWPHCVRWEPSSPPPKEHSPQFSAHICCGQIAAWIKMSHGMELGLGPGDFVLDGDPVALSPIKGAAPSLLNFGPISIVAKRLDASRCHLVWR